jgi:hypothetical protein
VEDVELLDRVDQVPEASAEPVQALEEHRNEKSRQGLSAGDGT